MHIAAFSPRGNRARGLLFFLLALAVVFAFAACGDKEPEQRAAFINVLQKNVLEKSGVRYTQLTEEQKKAMGPYVEHYTLLHILNDDHTLVDKLMDSLRPLQQKLLKTSGSADFAALLTEYMTVLEEGRKHLAEAEAKAVEKKKAFTQPDDLKVLYDKAFDKMVSQPIKAIQSVLGKTKELGDSAAALNKYIIDHPDQVSVKGGTVMIEKPEAEAEVTKLHGAIQEKVKEVNEEVRKMQELAR